MAFASKIDCPNFPFECAEEFYRSVQRELKERGKETEC